MPAPCAATRLGAGPRAGAATAGAGLARPPLPTAARRRPALPALARRPTGATPTRPALTVRAAVGENPFKYRRESSALEKTLASLPATAATAAAAAAVLAAGATGGAAGRAAVGRDADSASRTAAATVAAAATGGAAVAGVRAADRARTRGAAAELYNTLVDAADPGAITAEDIDALSARTGVDVRTRLVGELKVCYDAFVEAAIPPGATPLDGSEAERITAFKDALGLADEDAAPVHMDVGRRFMRGRLETTSRSGDAAGRAALAKLIYVSSLVFGDQKAAFLLPWRRVFDLSDAKLYVAKRDCARGLVRRWIDERGGGALVADRAWLADLEAARKAYRLTEDTMAEEVKAAARAGLEARLEKALAAAAAGGPASTRKPGEPVPGLAELREAAAYTTALTQAAGSPGLPPGLATPASVAGGPLASGPKASALSGLYRAFVEDALSGPAAAWSADVAAQADALASALALSPADSARIREGVAARAYKAALRSEVASGRLDAAPSKAAVLGELCERLGYDPTAAADMHRTIYRQKVDALMEKGGGVLSEEDGATLDRLRVLLCVPRADVEAVQKATGGKVYAAAVSSALGACMEGDVDGEAIAAALAARTAVRLDKGIARSILDGAARKAFLTFIARSRSARTREAQGRVLRDLVIFSNAVVGPLYRDVRTEAEAEADDRAAALIEAQEAMAKAQAEAAKGDGKGGGGGGGEEEEAGKEGGGEGGKARRAPDVDTGSVGLSKADREAAAAGAAALTATAGLLAGATTAASAAAAAKPAPAADAGMPGQTGITLATDLPRQDRLDTYRNFLLWAISGQEVPLSMGGTVSVTRDASEFSRVQQLAAILGLGPADTAAVQNDLAMEAYTAQVREAVSPEGALDPAKAASLEAVAAQLGLSKEAAAKAVTAVTSARVAGGLKAAGERGALTLQALLDMKEAGVDLASAVRPDQRQALYTAALANALKDGSGALDPARWLTDLPADLGLDPAKCAAIAAGLAKDKRRTMLVQAVSHLRQGERAAAAADLNNLLSCERAAPAGGPLSWGVAAELEALYGAYAAAVPGVEAAAKRAEVAAMLGLSADTVAAVEAAANYGVSAEVEAAEEEALF